VSTRSVAVDHYRRRRRLVLALAELGEQLWRRVDPDDISASWTRLLPELMVAFTGAQRAAAQQADGYLARVLGEQGVSGPIDGRPIPGALSGVAADGRPLDTLLANPRITALSAIQSGQTTARAMAAGYANLDMLLRTEVADAGRVADQIALTAHRGADVYVRMLVGKSCSRCAILAGRRYGWNASFNRHPRCDCIAIPGREDSVDDLRTDPRRYFDSLPRQEQDRLFTKAGAEAIREGADPSRVVNSRRGMYVAGGRTLTTEATTRAGVNRRLRLMPEQIFREANGNRDETLRLLRMHGYLT
jgi:hypothetical protein